MAFYKLKVIRTEERKDYQEEMKKWKEDQQYTYNQGRYSMPEREEVKNALEVELTEEQFEEVELTEEQFEAVKKAVLEIFK